MTPVKTETLRTDQLKARLSQLQAKYFAEHSFPPNKLVYFSNSIRHWMLVKKHGQLANVGYYVEGQCPCEG
jgi:hypothetical protein